MDMSTLYAKLKYFLIIKICTLIQNWNVDYNWEENCKKNN